MIAIKNLSFKYGRESVLKDISLEISDGEFILIAGNNGAGKSTFLKCLMGILTPNSGEVRFSETTDRKRMGYISDTLSFYEDLSIAAAIDFHQSVYGEEKLDETLIRQLKPDYKKKVKSLSVGERTLFLLALIMTQKPQLLLIDEIIHGIDPYLREMFLEYLLDLIARFNTTVIAVNHTFNEIDAIPERVLVMEDGHFVIDEPTETLKSKIKKIELGPNGTAPVDLPVIYKKESDYHKEYYVYPFTEQLAASSPFSFRDIELGEILKSFIGGYYVKKRI